MTASPSLAVISTVNASETDLEAFIAYHMRSPDIAMIVFLDRPEHMAYACISECTDRVTFIPCTTEYWQNELGRQPENMPEKQHTNIRVGARLTREMGLSWAISIDNDELIYPLESLPDLYGPELQKGIEAIQLRPLEAVHTTETAYSNKPFTTVYFRRWYNSKTVYRQVVNQLSLWPKLRVLTTAVFSRRGFLGHVDGKTIFNVNANITQYKQHRQLYNGKAIPIIPTQNYNVLHFDAINFDHWRQKWFRRTFGSTKATAILPARSRLTWAIRQSLRFPSIKSDRAMFNWLYVYSGKEIKEMKRHSLFIEINHQASK